MESEENLSLEKQNSENNISGENSSSVKFPAKTPIQEQSQSPSINLPAITMHINIPLSTPHCISSYFLQSFLSKKKYS